MKTHLRLRRGSSEIVLYSSCTTVTDTLMKTGRGGAPGESEQTPSGSRPDTIIAKQKGRGRELPYCCWMAGPLRLAADMM